MPSNYKSEIQTWEDANRYLGSKSERPLPFCANLRIRRELGGVARLPYEGFAPPHCSLSNTEIVVQLHGNTIVRFPGPNLPKEFPYAGHFENSLTTKRHRSAFGGPWKV